MRSPSKSSPSKSSLRPRPAIATTPLGKRLTASIKGVKAPKSTTAKHAALNKERDQAVHDHAEDIVDRHLDAQGQRINVKKTTDILVQKVEKTTQRAFSASTVKHVQGHVRKIINRKVAEAAAAAKAGEWKW